jgi:hypothetical protein
MESNDFWSTSMMKVNMFDTVALILERTSELGSGNTRPCSATAPLPMLLVGGAVYDYQ